MLELYDYHVVRKVQPREAEQARAAPDLNNVEPAFTQTSQEKKNEEDIVFGCLELGWHFVQRL